MPSSLLDHCVFLNYDWGLDLSSRHILQGIVSASYDLWLGRQVELLLGDLRQVSEVLLWYGVELGLVERHNLFDFVKLIIYIFELVLGDLRERIQELGRVHDKIVNESRCLLERDCVVSGQVDL